MEYELRNLTASDFGTVCKILSEIGVKQFKDCFDVGSKEKNAKKVGVSVVFDIAGIVMSNMKDAEKDIQTFLASLTGMKVAEIQAMDFADYGELILIVCMKEEFKDFFGRAMKLFNQ